MEGENGAFDFFARAAERAVDDRELIWRALRLWVVKARSGRGEEASSSAVVGRMEGTMVASVFVMIRLCIV